MKTSKTSKTSRREFLATAASAAVFSIVPRHVLGGPGHTPPSEMVNVALVGAGGRARQNLKGLLAESDCRVVAVADPAESLDLSGFFYKSVAGREPVREELEQHYREKTPGFRCATYEDFREMLDREKNIDAILCSTPDHLHAYVSVKSMQAGKHIYCEKPLTHNIWEARLVAKVAQETGVATQMGNQGHSTEGIRQTVEWLRDGAIGTVKEVHAWVPSGRWNKTLLGRPEGSAPVPAGLNWNLWLGPREERPYNPAYAPVAWRDFWAFGLGTLGDFGCHDLDAACWALNLSAPKTVEVYPAGPTNEEIQPHGEIGYFDFEARGDQQAVLVHWYGGGLKPPTPKDLPQGETLPARGVLFIGEKGVMLCGGAGGVPRLLPKELHDSYRPPQPSLPRSKGHYRDWLDACKGGQPASSNFGYGARLTEIVLLGVASLRTGKRIDWNPDQMTARGLPAADAVLHESYRKGWELV